MLASDLKLGDRVVLNSGEIGRVGALSLSDSEAIVRRDFMHPEHASTGWIPSGNIHRVIPTATTSDRGEGEDE